MIDALEIMDLEEQFAAQEGPELGMRFSHVAMVK